MSSSTIDQKITYWCWMVRTEYETKLFDSSYVATAYVRDLLLREDDITETEVIDDSRPDCKSYEVREVNRDISEWDLKYYSIVRTPRTPILSKGSQ